MGTRIVIDTHGRIVNRIVVDETSPNDFSLGAGLTLLSVLEAEIDVPALDGEDNPTGETETITVPLEIGGTYIDGKYAPPAEE